MRARDWRISSLDPLAGCHVEPAEEVAEAAVRVVDHGGRPVDDETLSVCPDVLVLDDPSRVVGTDAREVLLRASDVLRCDEARPERLADPCFLGDARRTLESAVDSEQLPARVHERQEARRRADDRSAEVALALELACLKRALGEVADDEDELVGAAGDRPALVVTGLPLDLQRVLDVLEHAVRDRTSPGAQHGVRDLRREPVLDPAPDHLVGRGQEVALGVDLEPAVDAVGADPEDRVGYRGDERAGLQVARGRLVQPRVCGRRAHRFLVPRSPQLRPAKRDAFRAPPKAVVPAVGFRSCGIPACGKCGAAEGGGTRGGDSARRNPTLRRVNPARS